MNRTQRPKDTTVLVTGISGFLGGHVALQLLQQGYRVRGSMRAMHSAPEIRSRFQPFAKSLSFVQADLDQNLCWADAIEGCDYVIHIRRPHFQTARCNLRINTAKAETMLQWQPRPEEETIRACGQSLIDNGLVTAGRKN
ncbi:NAD(P)-binding domain-containing protein (plasmid) [Rhizobium etli bv. mimosae str. IE4771]|uniref:NAD(P)-binding domain-containing protein n=1 Tax=Rhizobium etli bv. mimosae str. IE4771 TaxID=1432050 RepID=A0A060IAA7_RHIET|nr:NAD-dependent epimerase/dehydratase family protein [Rhizobium sp. IE4771]AIC30727.1 NAD(P)-binding domain-containing protein [Rhizobium sp. IE4771]